ncbi:MAG: DUF4358 domain-containing protein [Oscillospiraceae bacterium]|nr:DUF4358 domain-containing protein [Oscillospiraceae bacterium]
MKKSITATAAAIAVSAMLMLTGCNGGEEAVEANATISEVSEATANEITAAIMAEIEIPSAMEKTAENLNAYYDIDTATVAEMSVFICGSGAYPDELAVFRFNDEASAKAGAEAVQSRLDSQTAIYKDYTPAEMYKLEEAVIITEGNWIAFAACADNARAKEIIESML